MIEFTCPSCAKSLSAPDDAAGKVGICKTCNFRLQIPTCSESSDSDFELTLDYEEFLSEPKTARISGRAQAACPGCGFSSAWDGVSCSHCHHGGHEESEASEDASLPSAVPPALILEHLRGLTMQMMIEGATRFEILRKMHEYGVPTASGRTILEGVESYLGQKPSAAPPASPPAVTPAVSPPVMPPVLAVAPPVAGLSVGRHPRGGREEGRGARHLGHAGRHDPRRSR